MERVWLWLLPLNRFLLFYSLHSTLSGQPPWVVKDVEGVVDEWSESVVRKTIKCDVVLSLKNKGNEVI